MAHRQTGQKQLVWYLFVVAVVAAIVVVPVPSAHAAIKVFDGFGDADLDNNGTPLEFVDVDADRDEVIGEYTPGRLGMGGATNPEVNSVLDPSDVGLRWLFSSGYTNSNTGDPKPTIRIVDDTQGMMQETKPTTEGGLGITAIDDSYALSYNAKGRGSSALAFFDERIALGPEVGDQVRVSFDFRVWRDADNANPVVQPADAELRFGLYQDTDEQLGMTNPFAGRDEDINGDGFADQTPAVWGQEGGWFEGSRAGNFGPGDEIGAPGDHGWFGAVILEDPTGFPPPLLPNGGSWRIREETNEDEGGSGDRRIMQGQNDVDTVAVPQEGTPGAGDFGLINLNVNKVYNLALTLERFTDESPGDTILASLTATDREAGMSWTLSDYEPVENSMGEPDGIFSDAWDYFGIRNTGFDDFDMIIDNFMLEVIGSNEPGGVAGDFNDNGTVDAADYVLWRKNVGTDNTLPNDTIGGTIGEDQYNLWRSNFGRSAGSGSTVAASTAPEPCGIMLIGIGAALLGVARRR